MASGEHVCSLERIKPRGSVSWNESSRITAVNTVLLVKLTASRSRKGWPSGRDMHGMTCNTKQPLGVSWRFVRDDIICVFKSFNQIQDPSLNMERLIYSWVYLNLSKICTLIACYVTCTSWTWKGRGPWSLTDCCPLHFRSSKPTYLPTNRTSL